MDEFARYLTEVMNASPRFYDTQLGIEIQDDAKFLGYADSDFSGTRDSGEG